MEATTPLGAALVWGGIPPLQPEKMVNVMRIEGEAAAGWSAVRLDSLQAVEGAHGRLLLADTDTGEVKWTDKTGTACELRLGPQAIRLIGARR